jgi:DNA repair exonuclease SbcCD ATPase subunit
LKLLPVAEAQLLLEPQIKAMHHLQQQYLEQQATEKAFQGAEAEQSEVWRRLSAARTEAEKLEQLCVSDKQMIDALQPSVVVFKKQLQDAALIAEKMKQREWHLNRLGASERTLAQAPIDETSTRTALEWVNAELSNLNHAHQTSGTLLRAVGTSYKCPVCTQDVPQAMVDQHRYASVEREPKIQKLTAQAQQLSAELQQKTQAKNNAAAEKAMATRLKQESEAALLQLPAQYVVSASELAADQQTVQDSEAISALYNTNAGALSGARNLVSTLTDQFNRVSARLKQLTASTSTVTVEAFNNAGLALQAHQAANQQVLELRAKQRFFQEQEKTLQTQLEQLCAEEAQLDKLKAWRQTLEDARVILHRDQLPNMVAQLYIHSLNKRLARYLDLFEVPFTCRIRPDLSIECAKGGNVTEAAERLSGGEKVMLGIAFRFAVYDLFASNLGLLILDEPTVFLDEDHIQSVYSLLERVKSYSKAAGLQLIVVTHEKALAGVADRVIQL